MAKEQSFDVVSQIDMQEVDNAFQQARKELSQRYDLKGSGATVALDKQAKKIEMISQGRLQKYYKENTLLAQEYYGDSKMTVDELMKKANKDLTCTGYFRLQLGA